MKCTIKKCNKVVQIYLKHEHVGLVPSCLSCAEKAFAEEGENFIFNKKNQQDIPIIYLNDKIIDRIFGTEYHKRKVDMIRQSKKLNLSKNLIDNPEGFFCKCCEEKVKGKIKKIEEDLKKVK